MKEKLKFKLFAIVDCEDEVLTATFVITNMGTNTIPSGTEFDYEFTTDPELTEVVGQIKSGTYTLLTDLAPTETIEMSIEYENPECLTGSDITLTITVPVITLTHKTKSDHERNVKV